MAVNHEQSSSELPRIYDALFDFESKRKDSIYPIHKNLNIQGKSLLDWVSERLDLNQSSRILDAGCGTGNTLFSLHKRFGISGVGLSISKREVAFATEYAQKEQLLEEVEFHCQDFTESLDYLGSFDLIIAIESLKHNENPLDIIARFLSILNPKGQLIIIDDFLLNSSSNQDIDKHISSWSAPGFMSIHAWKEHLDQWGVNYEVTDLSAYVPSKKSWVQNFLLTGIRLTKHLYPSSSSKRRNLETYEGAILLERLYLKKHVGYFQITLNK